jgi:hypothetical protein
MAVNKYQQKVKDKVAAQKARMLKTKEKVKRMASNGTTAV